MASPSAASLRRKPRENEFLFDLGVRGRKTGLTLPDTGIRDEHGLETMDHLFSSPEKTILRSNKTVKKTNGARRNPNSTLSSEEDMDVGESTIPEPTAVLTERKRSSMRLPPPRSKSPIKTFLQSPARRNPSLGPLSSLTRRSVFTPVEVGPSASVRRKLDFSIDDKIADLEARASLETPGKNPKPIALRSASNSRINGSRISPLKRPLSPDNDNADIGDDPIKTVEVTDHEDSDDSYQMIQHGDDEEVGGQVDEPEDTPELEPQASKKAPKNPRDPTATEVAVKRGRGRPPKDSRLQVEPQQEERPTKILRRSLDGPEDAPKTRKGSGAESKKAAKAKVSKSQNKARNPNLVPISEAESPEIRRGPPLPRNNRGLFILRRETPMESNGFTQTRSGRNSIKPVAYWKNERVEYDEVEAQDGDAKFLLPRIKDVVRAVEVEPPVRGKRKAKARKAKRRVVESSSEVETDDYEDEESEPWESYPGNVVGGVKFWDPEEEIGYEEEDNEVEIAISARSIITDEILGASFKYVKTLSLPFFGSGVVDLPAGSIKKPKNSRRWHMVFFVFYGRVQVTVDATSFGIGQGGMWQVPRGNSYSIQNVHDKPARLFFSQGCELTEEQMESQ